jgi:hypothetical protein
MHFSHRSNYDRRQLGSGRFGLQSADWLPITGAMFTSQEKSP